MNGKVYCKRPLIAQRSRVDSEFLSFNDLYYIRKSPSGKELSIACRIL